MTFVNKLYMGEGKDSYSAMQGPAPIGYHIPSHDEQVALVTAMTALGIDTSNGNCMKTYMKMPFAGRRNNSGDSQSYWAIGKYWSCTGRTGYSGEEAYILHLDSSELVYIDTGSRAMGYSIRAFKDNSVTPDSNWTTLFDGSSIATGAGIFHNTSAGIISLSGDGINWITIADKNEGATIVYNDGDTPSQANCGNYYQWGNCYGFPRTGSVTTDTTLVDTTGYGPGNYYSSSTFITGNDNWSSVQNDNLRGGETGVQKIPNTKEFYMGEGKNDYSAIQGPTPTGYHIPSKDEWVSLITKITAFRIDTTNGNCMKTYLKMPFAGYRSRSSAGVNTQGTNGRYWSANAYNTNYAYGLYFDSSTLYPQNGNYRAIGFSLRCFKDIPVAPTSSWTTLYNGGSVATGAGVFHNTTDGLISISSDGINWITIADKNLGATQVYNDGDTLSQANCGNYYQRGNNYGFPFTGSVTTSGTQVDASTYGPGNYYSSSTFITGNMDWSSVQNDDLWGGETGVQKVANVKRIFQGTELVYGDSDLLPVDTPGIYYNPNLELVSMSLDGQNRFSIADRDLGGTPNNRGSLYHWGNGGTENWEEEITSKPGYRCITGSDYQTMRTIFNSFFGSNYDFRPYIYMTTTIGTYMDTNENTWYWIDKTPTNGLAYVRNFPEYTSNLPEYQTSTDAYISGISGYPYRGHPVRPVKIVPVQPDGTRTVLYQPTA